jgi:hypothetical protein
MPSRSIFSHLTATELEDFFNSAEFCVCFASSETFQYSYSTPLLKHGIWSYHVIEALKGDAPDALENGRYRTAASLQDHLTQSVMKTIANSLSVPVHQTPRLYGTYTSGTLLIADLKEVLDTRAVLTVPGYQQVNRLALTGSSKYRVSKLSGFAKHHTVPDAVNDTTEHFVARIGSNEVEEEINEVFDLLRTKMGYSLQDLNSGTDVGTGSIITPDFDYNVNLTLDPNDPSAAILRKELSNIKTPQLIDSQQFGEVFAAKFSSLELTLKEKIKLREWITKIETLKRQGQLADIQIYYPRDVSYCEIRFSGTDPVLTFYATSCQISQPFVESPAELFKTLLQMQTRLLGVPQFKQLPL